MKDLITESTLIFTLNKKNCKCNKTEEKDNNKDVIDVKDIRTKKNKKKVKSKSKSKSKFNSIM